MERYYKHIGVATGALAVALLSVGWAAVTQADFERVYLVPIIAASIALLVALIGALFRKPWVYGGGLLGVFVFCPSPFGFWPLLVGTILLTFFAVATHRAFEEEGRA